MVVMKSKHLLAVQKFIGSYTHLFRRKLYDLTETTSSKGDGLLSCLRTLLAIAGVLQDITYNKPFKFQ